MVTDVAALIAEHDFHAAHDAAIESGELDPTSSYLEFMEKFVSRKDGC